MLATDTRADLRQHADRVWPRAEFAASFAATMPGPRFVDSARSYFRALGRKDALPELPDETLDAFVEVLHACADEPHAFALLDFDASPYPALALGDEGGSKRIQWAAELAELETFVHPSEPGLYFFVDSHPDKSGKHRVYTLEQGIRGLLEFTDVPDALAWMAARVESAKTNAPISEEAERLVATLDDPHEDGATSGFYVLEQLLDAPLTEAYEAYSRGEWPVVDPQVEAFRLRRQGPWQRGLALYLVRRFLAQRIVDVPRSLKPAELGKPLRALAEYLGEFAEAITEGTVPEPIDSLVDAEDLELRKRARAWIARHDAWRARKSKPSEAASRRAAAPPPSEPPPAGDFGDDDDDGDDGDEPRGDGPSDDELRALLARVLGGKGGKGKSSAPPAAKGAASKRAAPEPEPEAEPPADTPFLRSLRIALDGALDEMIRAELVELDPANKPALLEELVEAGANARSAAHLLKSLTDALVDSDLIDEVFASDEQVERFIRSRLEKR